eukprot:TRINITY_DN12737_c0_g1_i7.p2 TRINITY_DN12737_c0_g1~~TRINITY_DN12737_c0_g1_i7.p2  ORF type:complete len:254 (-),score=17.07 TRINITY_DN12737_c0_g1_i7:103-864(-)
MRLQCFTSFGKECKLQLVDPAVVVNKNHSKRSCNKRVKTIPITCTRKEQIKDDGYEMKELVIPDHLQNKPTPAKNSGLRRAPSSGGVITSTSQYSLPSPAAAVRNLLELASYAHLCSTMSGMHHRRAGFPFATLAEFTVDGAGHPVFCLSPLDIHTRNLLEDPRVSMVVQMPGWTGLANARVTIFGAVYQLPNELRQDAIGIFDTKHKTLRNEGWVAGNSLYFRMHHIQDIYFVGGFGTVQWVEVRTWCSRPC